MFLKDSQGGFMCDSFENSKLITEKDYLLYFYTLGMRGMSHDLPLLKVRARNARSTYAIGFCIDLCPEV